MGIAFEALRNDERRRLTHSMRCLRAQESFILDQRTLTGVPVGVSESDEPAPDPAGQTIAGWAASPHEPESTGRSSRIAAKPTPREPAGADPKGAFGGGLDLAASVFSPSASD